MNYSNLLRDGWDKLDDVDKVKHKAKLELLEELAQYIDMLRESYTRELVVNDCKTEEELENTENLVKDCVEVNA